jgi:hypothetical protein
MLLWTAILAIFADATPCPSLAPTNVWTSRSDAAIVASVKAVPSCSVEKQLSPETLSSWLSSVIGVTAHTTWKVRRGCMLASVGSVPEVTPVCVEISWDAGEAEVGGLIVLKVGDGRRNQQTRLSTPSVDLILVTTAGGPETGIGSLAELERRLGEQPLSQR